MGPKRRSLFKTAIAPTSDIDRVDHRSLVINLSLNSFAATEYFRSGTGYSSGHLVSRNLSL
jgi:hypothetical protein